MPNWCYTSFSVKGKEKDIVSFVDAVTSREDGEIVKTDLGEVQYNLTLLHPCPDELNITATFFTSDDEEGKKLNALYDSNREKHGYANWYDWCWANWGTKWLPYIQEFEISLNGDESSVRGRYETAWSPCDNLWLRISEIYPSLVISTTYDEEANLFMGSSSFLNGVLYTEGTDFSQESLTALKPDFWERYEKIEKAFEEINHDWDHELYDEIDCDRVNLFDEIRDYCERAVEQLLSDAQ